MMHSEESLTSPCILQSCLKSPWEQFQVEALSTKYYSRFRHGTRNNMRHLMHDVDGFYVVSWGTVGCASRPFEYLLTVFLTSPRSDLRLKKEALCRVFQVWRGVLSVVQQGSLETC